MGTYNPMITQMIQDAVLKLCTQNIMFQKSLEIDGIICVSSGEEQRDIVVKMHRTIVKPEVAPTPVESWSSSIESDWQNTVNTNTPRNTSFDSYDSSTPIGNRRSESRPGHRGPYKSKHTVVNEPPKRTFNEVHEPPEPTATLETPGGLDIDSDYSVTNIKAEPDTSPNSKRKNSDSNLDQNEEVPAKLPKYNIKEEAITIELNDEDDDDGGEGDTETAGASWMGAEGDDTTRTFDNMDSMNNTYASADTGDESQMHDAGGAMQGAGGDMQGAGGDMGDQSDIVSACNDPDDVWLKSVNSDKQKNIVAHNVLEQPIELEKPDNDVLPKIIKSVANDKQVFACSACNFKTEKMWTAYRHKHTHSKRYVCHNCGKCFGQKSALDQHSCIDTPGTIQCSTCGKTYKTLLGLKRHEAEHTGNYSHFCDKCGKGFSYKNVFIDHQMMHMNLKFKCPKCPKKFAHARSLREHKDLCGKTARDAKCHECGKAFKSKRYLKEHIKFKHSPEIPVYTCKVCGKTFAYRGMLSKHKRKEHK